jgi:hypothetical protein
LLPQLLLLLLQKVIGLQDSPMKIHCKSSLLLLLFRQKSFAALTDEDPVLKPHVDGNGHDAHKQQDVFLLNFYAVVAQEQVQEAGPACS